jgi:ABC-type transporter Mla subunit MlaD
VANRFVSLNLGNPSNGTIPTGGYIPPTQTKGIVDLDVLLDSLTPRVRKSLQQVISAGAYVFKRPTAQQFDTAVHYLNPALSQTTQLGGELVADKFVLDRLISSTADVATTLAHRNGDLGGAVTSTAATLREIASERTRLQDIVARAPAVLHQAEGGLRDVDFTASALDPALRDLTPVAPGLAKLLTELLPAAANAVPMIRGVEALVPGARRTLTIVPSVANRATPAVNSLTSALKPVIPILAGFRTYAPDLIAGFFNALGGLSAAGYDANGHYWRIGAELSGDGAVLAGILGALTGAQGLNLGALNGTYTDKVARCPGGGGPAATNGGNPWNAPDLPARFTGTLCNSADNLR